MSHKDVDPGEQPTLPLSGQPRREGDAAQGYRRWGRFDLLERIGQGSFGEVYRAWDSDLEREIALKLLLEDTVHSEEQYRAILREARAMAAVQHPGVVHIYGVERHEGRVGFWTDYVQGITLARLIQSQGPLGYREAAIIGLDVSKALSAVHRSGLLHRDVKAENVMREAGGRILLMDFGLSTLSQSQTTIAGTPNYMAPELFAGAPAGVSADLYSLGILLYFLVTGEFPAQVNLLSAESAKQAIAQRKPLIDLRPDLPESFLRVVNIAIEAAPEKRYASAGQMAAALAECLGASRPEESLSPAPIGARRRTWLYPALGAALVILLAAGWAYYSGFLPLGKHSVRAATAASAPSMAGTSDDFAQYPKAENLLARPYNPANITAAVKLFQKLQAKDPSSPLAHAGLGRAYFLEYQRNKDPKLLAQAQQETSQAIQGNPNLSPPHVTLALIATMQGHAGLAMQQANQAISLDPHNAEAFGALASIEHNEGRTKAAIATLQHAIDLAPDDPRWPSYLGAYQSMSGETKQSLASFERSAALDPRNPIAYYDLGFTQMQMGHLQQAREYVKKDLAIAPDPYAYALLGNIEQLQKDYGHAVEAFRKAISLNPSDALDWGNLGDAYLDGGGSHEQAMHAFRKAIALAVQQSSKGSNSALDDVILGQDYAETGQPAPGEKMTRKALALSPDNPQVEYIAGENYELMGKRQRAIPLVVRALAAGYSSLDIENDPEMAKLRKDPAFQKALKKAGVKLKTGTN